MSVLDPDTAVGVAREMWQQHCLERPRHDRTYEFIRGWRGRPDVPEGATDEIKEIARLAVKNVLRPVVETYVSGLGVVGFRSPTASDNDPVWDLWQTQRMDARQAEIYRPAVSYGVAYVASAPKVDGGPVAFRPRSPRQLFAVYEDPQMDQWPVFSLETWIDTYDMQRRGLLLDGTHAFPLLMGRLTPTGNGRFDFPTGQGARVELDPEQGPFPHRGKDADGRAVCPVVRYVNGRDAEDLIIGEVAPLIKAQQAINAVNFDRMVVSRFGAFPQRYIIGWTGTQSEVARSASSRTWTFDKDPTDMTIGDLAAATTSDYSEMLESMRQDVAIEARVPLTSISGGTIANLSADALAMFDKPHQTALVEKRESFGESHEQLLTLGAVQAGLPAVDIAAEVVWRDTEARSFAQVVDGISKLTAGTPEQPGIPIVELLDLVPGFTQQKIESIRNAMRRGGAQQLAAQLAAAAQAAQQPQLQVVNGGQSG